MEYITDVNYDNLDFVIKYQCINLVLVWRQLWKEKYMINYWIGKTLNKPIFRMLSTPRIWRFSTVSLICRCIWQCCCRILQCVFCLCNRCKGRCTRKNHSGFEFDSAQTRAPKGGVGHESKDCLCLWKTVLAEVRLSICVRLSVRVIDGIKTKIFPAACEILIAGGVVFLRRLVTNWFRNRLLFLLLDLKLATYMTQVLCDFLNSETFYWQV